MPLNAPVHVYSVKEKRKVEFVNDNLNVQSYFQRRSSRFMPYFLNQFTSGFCARNCIPKCATENKAALKLFFPVALLNLLYKV